MPRMWLVPLPLWINEVGVFVPCIQARASLGHPWQIAVTEEAGLRTLFEEERQQLM